MEVIMELKYYAFCGYVFGDHVAGLVRAESLDDARERLRSAYADFDSWSYIRLEETKFDEDGVCEVYFGC